MSDWFKGVVSGVSDGAKGVVSGVSDSVSGTTSGVIDGASKLADAGGSVVSDIGTTVKDEASKLTDSSKGIDYFVFVQGNANSIDVAVRGYDDQVYQNAETVINKHVEIDSRNLKTLSEATGRYQFAANGNDNNSGYAEISPYKGSMAETNLGNFLNTPAQITSNFALSYGFYDAGPNDSDQSYIYLTENFNAWMGQLVQQEPRIKELPFALFALPGAHDSGMYLDISDDDSNSILQVGPNIPIQLGQLGNFPISNADKVRGIRNISLTQKETISTQLNLGVRYFDFRPGHYAWDADSPLYHQHNVVPGCSLDSFCNQIVEFLSSHPSEVVVVNLSTSGFAFDLMKPNKEDVLSRVQGIVPQTIQIGNIDDLQNSYGQLLAENKRLIVMWETDFNDSYSDAAYKTTDVNPIIVALNVTLDLAFEAGKPSMFQLQGSADGVITDDILSFITLSDATSLLMSTKGRFDQTTYQWLSELDSSNLPPNQPAIFLNDFADNALVYQCQQLSIRRFKTQMS